MTVLKARRFRPRSGPNSSKAGYVDFSQRTPPPKPPRLVAVCRCPEPCLVTAHQWKANA